MVRPAVCTPASVTNAIGSVSRCSDQGKSTKNGTTATMAAFTGSAASSQRRAASTPSANTTPRIQASGAKAAATATSRPTAQAARRAFLGVPVSIRPALIAISGSSTNATAVPRRPAATEPIATGSSA